MIFAAYFCPNAERSIIITQCVCVCVLGAQVCVCTCVCKEGECVCVCSRACTRVWCVCVCVYACMRVCMSVCVIWKGGKKLSKMYNDTEPMFHTSCKYQQSIQLPSQLQPTNSALVKITITDGSKHTAHKCTGLESLIMENHGIRPQRLFVSLRSL